MAAAASYFLLALALLCIVPEFAFGKGSINLGSIGGTGGSSGGGGFNKLCMLGLCPPTPTPSPPVITTTTTGVPTLTPTSTITVPTTTIPPTITTVLPTTTVTTVLPPAGTPTTITTTTTGPTATGPVSPTTTTVTSPTVTTTVTVPGRALNDDASNVVVGVAADDDGSRSRKRTTYVKQTRHVRVPRRRRLLRSSKVPKSIAKKNRRIKAKKARLMAGRRRGRGRQGRIGRKGGLKSQRLFRG